MAHTHTLNLTLPDPIYRHLQEVAEAMQQPLERIVQQSIEGNLPPSIGNVSPDIREELLAIQTAPVDSCAELALSQISPPQQARHFDLLEKNRESRITPEEKKELEALRVKADQLMFKKAYAWALLRWLGTPVPPLAELPVD